MSVREEAAAEIRRMQKEAAELAAPVRALLAPVGSDMAHYEHARDRFATPFDTPRLSERVRGFLTAVYSWMGAGLAITAITAWAVASSPQLAASIATNRPIFWMLVIAQLGIVLVLSARVERLTPATASLLFIAYAALTGVTLSFVLLVYTGASVASTFFVAGMMFAALALYGTLTHRDLQGAGQFLFMGLIGIVLASLVNLFLMMLRFMGHRRD